MLPEANNDDAPQPERTLSRSQQLRRLRRTEFGGFLTTLICFSVLMYMKQFILAAVVSGIMLLSLAVRLAALSASRRRQNLNQNRVRIRFSNPRALYLSLLDRDFNQNDYELLSALDNDVRTRGLSDAQLNRLPVYTYCEKTTKGNDTNIETKKDQKQNEIEIAELDSSGHSNSQNVEISLAPCKKIEQTKDICSVCLETLATGDRMRTLNCLHAFHKDCIDRWLKTKASCPICNLKIASCL